MRTRENFLFLSTVSNPLQFTVYESHAQFYRDIPFPYVHVFDEKLLGSLCKDNGHI